MRRGEILSLAFAGLLLTMQPLLAQALPVGPEFQANTYTSGGQHRPAIAMNHNGDFVLVWRSSGSVGTDTDDSSIQGRRYASDGTPRGDDFQVNAYTTRSQGEYPDVDMDADGNFVVVWTSFGSSGTDTDGYSIQARRFTSDGAALGDDIQVNSYTTGRQHFPAVAVGPDGDFVVAWRSNGSSGSDTSSYSVLGQSFNADGTTRGIEFQVNSYTTYSQGWGIDIGMAAGGDFAVVWSSRGSSGTDADKSYSVQGQRYDSDGMAWGSQFQVNTYTTYQQRRPSISMEANGDFVVVWMSNSLGGYDKITGQRYDSSGLPRDGEFRVNTHESGFQGYPAVAVEADGSFVVTWVGVAPGPDLSVNIQAQLYSSDGSTDGDPFQVNTYTTGVQNGRAVASNMRGDFVVAWHGSVSGGPDPYYSIQGQRFSRAAIFYDGFESGDTLAWEASF